MAKGTICKYCEHCLSCSYNLGGALTVRCAERTDYYGDNVFTEEFYDCDDFELPEYDKSCWDENGVFKPEYLPNLRSQIALGSGYITDYENSFGIQPDLLCDMLDVYLDWLYNNELKDSIENLCQWYSEFGWDITDEYVITKEYAQSKVAR